MLLSCSLPPRKQDLNLYFSLVFLIYDCKRKKRQKKHWNYICILPDIINYLIKCSSLLGWMNLTGENFGKAVDLKAKLARLLDGHWGSLGWTTSCIANKGRIPLIQTTGSHQLIGRCFPDKQQEFYPWSFQVILCFSQKQNNKWLRMVSEW